MSLLYVLLQPKSKRPSGQKWMVTRDQAVIDRHLAEGGNLGVVCGEASEVDVLDFDVTEAYEEMIAELGPLPVTVKTGSGKMHVYFVHEGLALPAKLRWKGGVIGEIQRGPNQYVVCPPSVHPDTGLHYEWVAGSWLDTAVLFLPDKWREAITLTKPDFIANDDRRGQPEAEVWMGPTPAELMELARKQPGAKMRASGVKFQCPKCREDGHDRTKDNATVFRDGRWGCAFAPGDASHRRAIGQVLGVLGEDIAEAEEPGEDLNVGELDGDYFDKA